MATKPTVKPEWASQDETDPVTGSPNKVRPTSEYRLSGEKRGQPVPRAFLNFQFDNITDWIDYLDEKVDELVLDAGSAVIEAVYPVGSYYITSSNDDPATTFGFGTWAKVEGKFIVGRDTGDTAFDGVGETGGSKTHTHSDTFSVNSAGSHSHTVSRDGWGSQSSGGNLPNPTVEGRLITGDGTSEAVEDFESLAHAQNNKTTSSAGSHTHGLSGGVQSSSNLPPYEVANIWKRTA